MFAWSQDQKSIDFILKNSNTKQLEQLKSNFTQKFLRDSLAVENFLASNPTFSKRFTSKGVTYELQSISDGQPVYFSTDNLLASKATRTVAIQPGGELGLNLTGEGMLIGVWDGGSVLKTHVEFQNESGSRITTPDMPLQNPPSDGHATHVAGTVGAAGIDPNAKGMATHASILSYNWTNDLAEVTSQILNNGLLLSNHSYGVPPFNDEGSLSVPLWVPGSYSSQAVNWDDLSYNSPYYLMVTSAGNSGVESYSGGLKTGYDKLTHEKNSKNNLVIANANPFVGPTGFLINVVINSSSSQGPSDDGRIKPDIAGDGTQLFSTYNTNPTSYETLTGTSMASPNVAGSLLLLQEHYYNIHQQYMRAATLKGLVCHTAFDAGPIGPDAKFGWGLLDARESAIVLNNAAMSSPVALVKEFKLNQGETMIFSVTVDTPKKLKATISWTDLPGPSQDNIVNSSTPVLVNDLDIRITKGADVSYPWKLQLSDVSAPAIKGDNIVDNVEKIEVDNAMGTYTVQVSHKGSLTGGPQSYSLIVSGFDSSDLSAESYSVEDIRIYPNPANDVLNFVMSDSMSLDKVEIYDAIGKRVFSSNVYNNSINISELTSGVYFVKAFSGERQITKKIVKN